MPEQISALLETAAQLVDRFGLASGGAATTDVPGVHVYHQLSPVKKAPMLYRSGVVFILSGAKRAHLDGRSFVYDQTRYLALGLPLVVECEAIASPFEPLFGLYVEIDPILLRNVALAMDLKGEARNPDAPSIATAPFSDDMTEVVGRLMRQLCSGADSAMLGDASVREIVYRALQGPASVALRGLLNLDGRLSRVAEVMAALHKEYPKPFSVEDMARMAGMSPSVFHRAFRQATNDTPLQYLKKLRLTQASALIVQQGFKVGAAASSVGYESAAQFSRDFKNHFGVNAVDAKKLGSSVIQSAPDPRRAPSARLGAG